MRMMRTHSIAEDGLKKIEKNKSISLKAEGEVVKKMDSSLKKPMYV